MFRRRKRGDRRRDPPPEKLRTYDPAGFSEHRGGVFLGGQRGINPKGVQPRLGKHPDDSSAIRKNYNLIAKPYRFLPSRLKDFHEFIHALYVTNTRSKKQELFTCVAGNSFFSMQVAFSQLDARQKTSIASMSSLNPSAEGCQPG